MWYLFTKDHSRCVLSIYLYFVALYFLHHQRIPSVLYHRKNDFMLFVVFVLKVADLKEIFHWILLLRKRIKKRTSLTACVKRQEYSVLPL